MTKIEANQPAHRLTIAQTDELILNAATLEDGAIEDCEETTDAVKYFFESGAVGTVSRVTAAVEITKSTPSITPSCRVWGNVARIRGGLCGVGIEPRRGTASHRDSSTSRAEDRRANRRSTEEWSVARQQR
jgi:hypothetical protein